MTENELYKILKIILEKIGSQDLNWRLDGSANLLVQGIKLLPNDLDITVDENAKNYFKKRLLEYFMNEKIDTLGGAEVLKTNYKINGIEVETVLRNNEQLDMLEKVEKITWQGLELPIIPLQLAKDFYEKIGRQAMVDLIDDFLSKNS